MMTEKDVITCSNCLYGPTEVWKECGSTDRKLAEKLTKQQMAVDADTPACKYFIDKNLKEKIPLPEPNDIDEGYIFTDMRNSRRLALKINGKVKYNTTMKDWMVFNGKIWEKDTTGEMLRFARQVTKDLQHEALNIEDHDDKIKAMINAIKCESASRLNSMVELCHSELNVCINTNSLDTNQMLFNVQNGTIDLKTGALLPHNSLDYMTKISHVSYDKDAKCPIFQEFLLKIMANNTEMVEYLQKLFGYCMTGNTMEKGFYVFHGVTDTGKSTLDEMVLYIMGGYGATSETSMILSNKFRAKTTNDLADLVGVRFVCASETEDGAALDESRIKMITSGLDSIRCRQLYQENIEYKPTYKMVLSTNSKPYIRGSDDAIWNRLHCVPFDVQIPKNEQDKKLVEKMKQEGSGILNWMIEGCIKWQKDGLKDPEIMVRHTQEYRESMDFIKVFLDEYYVKEKGEHNIVPNKEMYEKFKNSQLSEGIDVRSIISIKTFIVKLSNSGLKNVNKHRSFYWLNIREKNIPNLTVNRDAEANSGESGESRVSAYEKENSRISYTHHSPDSPESDNQMRNPSVITCQTTELTKMLLDYQATWGKGLVNSSNETEFAMKFVEQKKPQWQIMGETGYYAPSAIKGLIDNLFKITPTVKESP